MANITGVTTNFFPTAQEGFTTTTSGTVGSGATSVGLNSVAGYSNGDVITLVIDPTDAAKKQVFTGVVDTSGVQITSVVWTEGTNQGHTAGSTVVDYETATAWALYNKGLLVSHDQDGTLKTSAVQDALNTGGTSSGGWEVLANAPTLTTTNGNRSFDITFPGVDYTDRLSQGMRLKIPRTGTTPTQSADFNGTTQYASKSSPTGITFTDDFTIETWLDIDSYPSVAGQILGRRNGTTAGWQMRLEATGQINVLCYRIAANNRTTISNSSVPLGRKVHVAATIDLSGNVTKIYIDGLEVSTTTATTGTITALVQPSVDMSIAADSAALFYDGRISDVRLWSVVRTAAQIRDNMNQQLTGSETNLVGYWKLNGDFNDSTANANNLTANAGVTATYADNPFNTNAYAIVTSTPVFSAGNTTMTVQTANGFPIPNQTLGTASYSSVKVPYGFPSSPNLWSILSVYVNQTPSVVVAANTWGVISSVAITVPKGSWNIGYKTTIYYTGAGGTYCILSSSLTTNSTSPADDRLSVATSGGSASMTAWRDSASACAVIDNITQATYSALVRSKKAGSVGFLDEDNTPFILSADCAYL